MTLGDAIKEYRSARGLSQDIIAARSNLSKAYISILERNKNPKTGEPPVPTLKTIKAIAAAIESDFDTLFSKLDCNLRVSISEQMPPDYQSVDNKQPTPDTGGGRLQEFLELFSQLTAEEQSLVIAQIKGILASR